MFDVCTSLMSEYVDGQRGEGRKAGCRGSSNKRTAGGGVLKSLELFAFVRQARTSMFEKGFWGHDRAVFAGLNRVYIDCA